MFSSIVIWGWPLHSHTHSYIHNAFYRAYRWQGKKVQWFDNKVLSNEQLMTIEEGSLFITEGQVDSCIPLLKNCFYLLHNCNSSKYSGLQFLQLQVLTAKTLAAGNELQEPYIRFDGSTLYMPWATDLLPEEIDNNISNIQSIAENQQATNKLTFIGYLIDDPWKTVKDYCQKTSITFEHCGGFGSSNVSIEENMRRVQNAKLAPAFQSKWQIENGYIPCRIFKNISYGAVPISTNAYVRDLFTDFLDCFIYADTVESALDKAINAFIPLKRRIEIMQHVRDKHTYLNRIDSIATAFEQMYGC